MTIKEKMNIRISRIREYKELVAKYRDIASKFMSYEIGVEFDENDPEPIGCIKTKLYHEDGGSVFPVVKVCEYFNDVTHCPVSNCSYHDKYEQYKSQEILLRQAKLEKRKAFKRLFERIK